MSGVYAVNSTAWWANRTVGEVAAAVGMSRSYFSRMYLSWTGESPGAHLPDAGP